MNTSNTFPKNMYGWINDCVEKFLISHYGIETWEEIKVLAGIRQPDGQWSIKSYYPDGTTYALIETAAKKLNIPVPDMYREYGSFFIRFVSERGYDNLLRCLGGSLREWFSRVNLMHSHLEYSLPNIIAPDFW